MTWPGPGVLGRGIVISPGGSPPDPWAGVPVVVLDGTLTTDDDRRAATLERLHRAWVHRTPLVVVWDLDEQADAPETSTAAPWEVGADFLFPMERLRFLCFTNNYDARLGEPRWWWTTKAARIGAIATDHGDAVLPDGRPVWIDGGPRHPLPELDLPVIHGETVETGGSVPVPEPATPTTTGLAGDQMAAVGHSVGAARIIAPAGSGKTRTLTARLSHLLDGHRIEPEHVVAVAYNERAASELRRRLGVGRHLARTVHSLGWEILRQARPGLELVDEREVRRLLDRLLSVPRRANADPFAAYLEALSQVRSGLRDPADVEASRDDVTGFADAFERFRRELYRRGGVDHAEQVYGAIEALLVDPALRRRWQRRCRHLLVDEFQDLTPAYLLLLRLVASPELDVFAVGDDDQVIYGYDGADPGFLIDFEARFPGAGSHALEVNYRCPPSVVEAARHLLSYNRRRIDKTVTAARSDPGPGALDVVRHPGAELAEVCAGTIVRWIDGGEPPSSIVVLTRVNSSLIPVKAALVERSIPVEDRLGPGSLQRSAVAALFSWLRIGLVPERIGRGDLLDAIRRPGRGLTRLAGELLPRRRMTIDEVRDLAGRLDGRQAQRWRELGEDLVAVAESVATGDATVAIRTLIDDVGLGASARALDSGKGNASRSGHLDDLVAVQRAAAIHGGVADFIPWLQEVVAHPARSGGVTLSTVHRVKGMEWPNVVVFGADRGSLPHDLGEDLEEERRVFHVALTRATTRAVVLADQDRPSRFLAELTGSAPHPGDRRGGGDAPATKVGDTVRLWGGVTGLVVAREGDTLTVRLETGAEVHADVGDVVEATPPARKRQRAVAITEDPTPDPMSPADGALVETLKTWRLETARARQVPAYVVFSDRTLHEIARLRPDTEGALLAVNGIGPAKLELFGDDVLAIVATGSPTGT